MNQCPSSRNRTLPNIYKYLPEMRDAMAKYETNLSTLRQT